MPLTTPSPNALLYDTDNLTGAHELREMTSLQHGFALTKILSEYLANNRTFMGVNSVGVSPLDLNIGTFTNREMNNAVGTHPVDPNDFSSTVYYFYITNAGASGDDYATNASQPTVSPVYYDETDNKITEYDHDDTAYKSILDNIIYEMANNDEFAANVYWLSASAPTGDGTWSSVHQIDDTQVDGTTVTKYLWKKTASKSTLSAGQNDVRPLKLNSDGSLSQMTDSEIEGLETNLHYRLSDAVRNGLTGKYVLDTAAPGTGTWQQMGETLTDQLKDTASYNYAGTYTGSYTGNYTGYYSGTYSGAYAGTYRPSFNGFLGGSFTGYYTGFYTGSYAGTYSGSYSGNYTGYYAGVTVISSSSTQETKKLFVRID